MKKLVMTPRLVIWLVVAGLCVFGLVLHVRQADKNRPATPAGKNAGKIRRDVVKSLRSSGNSEAQAVAAVGSGKSDQPSTEDADQQSTNKQGVVKMPPLTPSQKKAKEMRLLLDDGNERAAMRLARELFKDEDPDVRADTVTVLGWVGVRALPELSQMLDDEVENIAEEAMTQWKMAFDEIQDSGLKAELLTAAMLATEQETRLEELAILSSQLPENYAVRAMVEVIEGPNSVAAAVARGHYEFMTQTPYSGRQDAESWMRQQVETEAGAAESAPTGTDGGTSQ